MKSRIFLVVLCAFLVAHSAPAQQDQDAGARADLGTIRGLYAAAAYEEALARLPEVSEPGNRDLLSVYRALCLLALGKTTEVDQTLELLVKSSPLYALKDQDVSPLLVEMFREVRQRTLPNVERDLYAKAKASYDEKRYADADASLTQLLMLLNEADVSTDPAIADLKLLATGFRELALAQLAAPSNSTGPAARPDRIASTADVVAGAPVAGGSPAAIFTAADAGITAPVELTRVMPPWRPAGELTRRSFFGVLEIVVNEQGAVETAVIRERVTPAYDAALLKAAKSWSFRPATKDGVPVKYRTFVRILLKSTAD